MNRPYRFHGNCIVVVQLPDNVAGVVDNSGREDWDFSLATWLGCAHRIAKFIENTGAKIALQGEGHGFH